MPKKKHTKIAQIYRVYKRPNVPPHLICNDHNRMEFISEFDTVSAYLKFLQDKMFVNENNKYVFIVKKYINGIGQRRKIPMYISSYYDKNTLYYSGGLSNSFTDVWYKHEYAYNCRYKKNWDETGRREPNECSDYMYDYPKILQRCMIFKEDLIKNRFHPRHICKFRDWKIDEFSKSDTDE